MVAVGGSGRGHRALNSAGATISRLRILPVGPFGSASTNHTCRGYLYARDLRLDVSRSSSTVAVAPGLQRDRGADLLAEQRVRQPDDGRLRNAGCS